MDIGSTLLELQEGQGTLGLGRECSVRSSLASSFRKRLDDNSALEVHKCFTVPSGMRGMVCSPQLVQNGAKTLSPTLNFLIPFPTCTISPKTS